MAGPNHPDQAPTPAVNLGFLEDEQGNPDAARAAYQLAIDSDHPVAAETTRRTRVDTRILYLREPQRGTPARCRLKRALPAQAMQRLLFDPEPPVVATTA